jgi:hypothetical protein
VPVVVAAWFPPAVLKISNQLFFLRVNGNGRLPLLKLPLDPAIEIFKLRIAVRMPAAFQRLTVGLQTVAQFVQRPAHQ